MPALGRTGLDVFPICLGGNVFGWTADEQQSREVLDAYVDAGGNFIDTANSYLVEHGRSETIIGRWMADRGTRDELVVATKVGGGKGAVRNLRAETIEREARASLERLQTDRIDGFLSGKYRPAGKAVESERAAGASAYLQRGGEAVLEALDEVAGARGVPVAAVAVAWLLAHPRVVAPIASARTVEQLEQILPAAELELTAAEIDRPSATTR